MSYVEKTNLANKSNYGEKRSTSSIKYIVIHYTGNDGDTDESNAKYFKNNVVKASAHYFVDDDSVTQSVPDNYVAWSVGGSKWADASKTGGASLYNVAKNSNTLNIEMCDTKKDGAIKASAKTINNTVELCKKLMTKYGIDVNHVIRHFDVTGKHCPAYFMDSSKWEGFKAKLVSKKSFQEYKAKVSINNLNIRTGPGTNYPVVGQCGPGVFTIVDEQPGQGSSKGFGKLKSGAGWISLYYATKV